MMQMVECDTSAACFYVGYSASGRNISHNCHFVHFFDRNFDITFVIICSAIALKSNNFWRAINIKSGELDDRIHTKNEIRQNENVHFLLRNSVR